MAHVGEPPRRRRRWGWALLSAPAAVVVIAAGGLFVRMPYDVIQPGRTPRVNDLVLVKGTRTYPSKGAVLYPTVSLRERVSPFELVAGWLDRNADVEPDSRIRGPVPPKRFEQLNQELMSESKRAAEVVVLRRLGYPVAQGAVIEAVEPGYPATPLLRPQDVVLAADGKPVSLADELVATVRAHKPHDHMKLRVARGDGPPRDVDVELGGGPGHTLLGVRASTKVKPPFDVTIDSGDVGGPSAGLAYALELEDLLTPGDLTHGRVVAATGEIGFSGQVLPVGGVAQKTIAVRRAGARLFLVPRANLAEATAHRGKYLDVVPVDDFDQALRILDPPRLARI